MGATSNTIVSGTSSGIQTIATSVPVSCASSATNELLYSVVLPTLSAGQCITVETQWSVTNSANSKIFLVQFGGQDILNLTQTTIAGLHYSSTVMVRSTTTQLATNKATVTPFGTTASSGPTALTVDLSTPTTLSIYGNKASAGDTLTLEFCVVRFN